jgi:SAM-dependent methyltransferase
MCGSGRFLIPLLEHGLDVDGVDASPHMLEACRRRCRDRGLTPTLYQQFLHDLDVSRRYALVFIPAGSFGLIVDPNRVRESIRRIHEVMSPGAKLVLEVEGPPSEESYEYPWSGRWVTRADGAKIVLSSTGGYDAESHVAYCINRYELVRDGRLVETEFEDFDVRHYDRAEFRALLTSAGFTELAEWRLHEFTQPGDGDADVVFEATKPPD